MIIDRTFNSVRALALFCRDSNSIGSEAWDDSLNPPSNDWDFSLGYDGSVTMGLNGGLWKEGAEKMKRANIETTIAMSAKPLPEIDYSVVGHTLDVPEYLSGSPTHWLGFGDDDENRSKVLRIGVSTSRVAMVGAPSMLYRGAAILSLIDKLEANNYRCELYTVFDNAHSGVTNKALIKTMIKSATDNWNPSTVAFALCHSGFHRRLGFKCMSSIPELAPLSNEGYGTGSNKTHANKHFDLYFNGVDSDIPYETPEKAAKTVLREYEDQAYKGVAA